MLTPIIVERTIAEIDAELGDLADAIGDAETDVARKAYEYDCAYLEAFWSYRMKETRPSEYATKAYAEEQALEQLNAKLAADAYARTLKHKKDILLARLTAQQSLARFVAGETGLIGRGR